MVKFQYDEIRARGVRLGLALAWLNLYCAWSIMVTCRISSFPIVLDLVWTEIAEAGLIFHGICFGQGEHHGSVSVRMSLYGTS